VDEEGEGDGVLGQKQSTAVITSRLMFGTAVTLLDRALEIYTGYGDSSMVKKVENRVKAVQWSLERQGR
jgi:hypothetical protein